MRLLLINGPNLARLGKREPSIYGTQTLDDVVDELSQLATELQVDLQARQSNHEGDLIDWIGSAEDEDFDGILLNPGAYTHTSYALYDAIKGADLPVVEVHISNPEAREPFRSESRVAPACLGKVAGFGTASYRHALIALVHHLTQRASEAPTPIPVGSSPKKA
jgi:3-dehydroquinate dehydratase-2